MYIPSPACCKVVQHCTCKLSSHHEQEDTRDSRTQSAFGKNPAEAGSHTLTLKKISQCKELDNLQLHWWGIVVADQVWSSWQTREKFS